MKRCLRNIILYLKMKSYKITVHKFNILILFIVLLAQTKFFEYTRLNTNDISFQILFSLVNGLFMTYIIQRISMTYSMNKKFTFLYYMIGGYEDDYDSKMKKLLLREELLKNQTFYYENKNCRELYLLLKYTLNSDSQNYLENFDARITTTTYDYVSRMAFGVDYEYASSHN